MFVRNLIVIISITVSFSPESNAQESDPASSSEKDSAQPTGSPAKKKAQRGSGPLVIDSIVVEGKVQRPDVFMIINRQNIDNTYELDLRESFIPKIKDSMKKDPL